VLGWAGMRGVVTLAAAFVIPERFPQRDLLVLIALVVTAGTLFIQGLTLPWLVRRLRLLGPDARGDALARAALFQGAGRAGRAWLDEHTGGEDAHGTLEAVRRRAEQRDFAAWERVGSINPDVETPSETYARLRRHMLQAERERVLEVRSSGQVAHEVVAEVLAALDVEESMLDVHHDSHQDVSAGEAPEMSPTTGQLNLCEHLARAGTEHERPPEAICADCVAEGTSWVHLRMCLTCGHVGCCDSSPRRWCFVDDRLG